MAGDVQRSLSAGFASHSTKPVRFEELHDAMIRVATGANASAGTVTA